MKSQIGHLTTKELIHLRDYISSIRNVSPKLHISQLDIDYNEEYKKHRMEIKSRNKIKKNKTYCVFNFEELENVLNERIEYINSIFMNIDHIPRIFFKISSDEFDNWIEILANEYDRKIANGPIEMLLISAKESQNIVNFIEFNNKAIECLFSLCELNLNDWTNLKIHERNLTFTDLLEKARKRFDYTIKSFVYGSELSFMSYFQKNIVFVLNDYYRSEPVNVKEPEKPIKNDRYKENRSIKKNIIPINENSDSQREFEILLSFMNLLIWVLNKNTKKTYIKLFYINEEIFYHAEKEDMKEKTNNSNIELCKIDHALFFSENSEHKLDSLWKKFLNRINYLYNDEVNSYGKMYEYIEKYADYYLYQLKEFEKTLENKPRKSGINCPDDWKIFSQKSIKDSLVNIYFKEESCKTKNIESIKKMLSNWNSDIKGSFRECFNLDFD